jgi:hypothetical protein
VKHGDYEFKHPVLSTVIGTMLLVAAALIVPTTVLALGVWWFFHVFVPVLEWAMR